MIFVPITKLIVEKQLTILLTLVGLTISKLTIDLIHGKQSTKEFFGSHKKMKKKSSAEKLRKIFHNQRCA